MSLFASELMTLPVDSVVISHVSRLASHLRSRLASMLARLPARSLGDMLLT